MLVGSQPRVRICSLPTPLVELPRFSDALDGPRILMKRDDLTGVAFGGNKARELEFLLGEAVAAGADTVITCGDVGSNHACMTAAAAARLGLRCHLVLWGGERQETPGNLLLDRVLGAEVRLVDTNDMALVQEAMGAVSERVAREGRTPCIIPFGGASPSGSMAYVNCVLEMAQQLNEMRVKVDHLFLASGSGGTQAGLVLGVRWMMPASLRVVGISTVSSSAELRQRVARHANGAAEALGAPFRFAPDEVIAYDEYLGQGYGKPTAACLEAIVLMARTEGILLDPVYSGKGVAGMVDLIRRGDVGRNETVVFLHTGGWPAILSYRRELQQALGL